MPEIDSGGDDLQFRFGQFHPHLFETLAKESGLGLGFRRPLPCLGQLLTCLVEVAELVEEARPLIERNQHSRRIAWQAGTAGGEDDSDSTGAL